MDGSPQKNQVVAPQQMNQDVMQAVKRKGKPSQPPAVEKAKRELRTIFSKSGIRPETVVKAGKMAEAAIADPAMYPAVIQMALKEGLIPKEQIKSDQIDYQLLAAAVSAGKLSQMIIDDGEM